MGTLDAALLALDARTGKLLWEVQLADTKEGYELTAPPLVVKDKIITGISGGEFGIRGFVEAYDPATGKKLWHFNAIPGPEEFGNNTWEGDSWQHGSGGTWMPGTYDPELNTVYWTVGNPGPVINGDMRKWAIDSIHVLSCGTQSRYRYAQVALPVHSERYARLGFH